ncbi:MAG TPA: hypothetical protein VFJ14_01865 [Nocardioidaceae bacterium]|nr:hypothetical protein [Nocardioidaceae bacterium]
MNWVIPAFVKTWGTRKAMEITAAVASLASDHSSFMTSLALLVDGGIAAA